jgi:hypothetical protein
MTQAIFTTFGKKCWRFFEKPLALFCTNTCILSRRMSVPFLGENHSDFYYARTQSRSSKELQVEGFCGSTDLFLKLYDIVCNQIHALEH